MTASRPRLNLARKSGLVALALSATLLLAACENSEKRAARHYGQALTLVSQGDPTRALLELRNVFRFDNTHQEARKLYADLNMEMGNLTEAGRHYLLLVEQYPDMVEVRQILAELAIENNNWDEVRRHGTVAQQLAPDDTRSKIIGLALAYHQAAVDRDTAARENTFTQARALAQDVPDSLTLRRLVIDYLFTSADPQSALPEIEDALRIAPEDMRLHLIKLQVLFQANDVEGVTDQLETAVRLFPEETNLTEDLLRWYALHRKFDRAEDFLRGRAGAVTETPDRHLEVVEFLIATQGRDAGRAELERLAAATEGTSNAAAYRAALAMMDFQDGATQEAIATVEALVAEGEMSDQTRDLRMRLAAMYLASERVEDARIQVNTILEQDRTHVDALMQRASWALEAGETGAAVADLRTAQAQAPRNPRIMTLLASAFAQDGNTDLAGEQLAMAVQASNNAVPETLRYVSFLRQQGRPSAIESLLNDARRMAPQDPAILLPLAELYLGARRWTEARDVAAVLDSSANPEVQVMGDRVRAAILLGQNRVDEGLSVLEQQVAQNSENLQSVAIMLTAQMRAGRAEEARTALAELRAQNPDSVELLLLSANLEAMLGNAPQAEAEYRAVLAARPDADNVAQQLYGLLRALGRNAEADEVLRETLQNNPESLTLLWLLAQNQESAGDFESSIATYEQMYAIDPNNVIVLNNLASMITTYFDDPDKLERARDLVRPLRNTTVPAFQDTVGWIAYRTGDVEGARGHLEQAATGLPQDAMVQYHLGVVYAALDLREDAIRQLELALELGEGRILPQLDHARSLLAELQQ